MNIKYLLLLLSFGVVSVVCSDSYDDAVMLIRQGEYVKATVLLEEILRAAPNNTNALRMLASVYEQQGLYTEAETLLEKSLDDISFSAYEKSRFAFDYGLFFSRRGESEKSIHAYTSALEYHADFSAAYLNRANQFVTAEMYEDAVRDYREYLTRVPASHQRAKIEQIIRLLTEGIVEQRQQEIRKAQIEADREQKRKELLDSVLDSLNNTSEDATILSVENEDLEGYEEELDIRD